MTEEKLNKLRISIAFVFMGLGVAAFLSGLMSLSLEGLPTANSLTFLGVGFALLLVGACFVFGWIPQSVKGFGLEVEFAKADFQLISLGEVEKKELAPEVKARRQAYAENKPVPGIDAPPFNVLTDVPDARGMPGADSMVPMYI